MFICNKYIYIYIYIYSYYIVFQAEDGTYLKTLRQEGVWFALNARKKARVAAMHRREARQNRVL